MSGIQFFLHIIEIYLSVYLAVGDFLMKTFYKALRFFFLSKQQQQKSEHNIQCDVVVVFSSFYCCGLVESFVGGWFSFIRTVKYEFHIRFFSLSFSG